MAFDFDDFRKEKYQDRTKEITLKKFGESGEDQAWKIRGLDAVDLARIDEAADKNKNLQTIIEMAAKATGGDPAAAKEAVSSIMGTDRNVPDNLVREYVVFERGSVEPKPKSRADSVKFANVHPVEFKTIVREIYTLTGLGQVAKKKPMPTGENPKSEPIQP